jgi:hypothetical protein
LLWTSASCHGCSGEPALLRRAALRFDLAQLVGLHPSAAALLAAIPFL